jgi:hypothetical protein
MKNRNGGKNKNGFQPKGDSGGNKSEVVSDCNKCGRSHHKDQCPAADQVCHNPKCKQRGHFARMCPKRDGQGKKHAGQNKKGAATTPFKDIKVDEWSKQAVDTITYKALNKSLQCLYPDTVMGVLDTGCSKTTVPPVFIKYSIDAKPTQASIKTANADADIEIDTVHTHALPECDMDGNMHIVLEEAYITDKVDVPLIRGINCEVGCKNGFINRVKMASERGRNI